MNMKRYCRLRRLAARAADRMERVRNKAGIGIGVAFPDGRWEADGSDLFRYCRQILAGLRDPAFTIEQRKQLVAVARYMRIDEVRDRTKRGKRWKGKIFP